MTLMVDEFDIRSFTNTVNSHTSVMCAAANYITCVAAAHEYSLPMAFERTVVNELIDSRDGIMINDKGRDAAYVTQLVDCLITIDSKLTQFLYGMGYTFRSWFNNNLPTTHANVILDEYPQTAHLLLLMAWDVRFAYNNITHPEAFKRDLFRLFTGNMDTIKLKCIIHTLYSPTKRTDAWTRSKFIFCDYLAVHENTHKGRSPWLQLRDGLHQGPPITVRGMLSCSAKNNHVY